LLNIWPERIGLKWLDNCFRQSARATQERQVSLGGNETRAFGSREEVLWLAQEMFFGSHERRPLARARGGLQ